MHKLVIFSFQHDSHICSAIKLDSPDAYIGKI